MAEQRQTQDTGPVPANNLSQPASELAPGTTQSAPSSGPLFAAQVGEGAPAPEMITPVPSEPLPDPKVAADGSEIIQNDGATLVSQDPAPAVTEPPEIIDVPLAYQDGARLICTKGNWNNVPVNYVYAWHSSGAPVGSNQDTYDVTPEMVGFTFTCTVTASNAGGSTMATSGEVVVVEPPVAA